MNSTRQPKLFLSCVRPNPLVLRVLRIKKLECSSRMNELFFNREVSLNPTDKIMQNFRSFVVGTSSIRVLPQTPHHPKKRQYIFTTHFCFSIHLTWHEHIQWGQQHMWLSVFAKYHQSYSEGGLVCVQAKKKNEISNPRHKTAAVVDTKWAMVPRADEVIVVPLTKNVVSSYCCWTWRVEKLSLSFATTFTGWRRSESSSFALTVPSAMNWARHFS